jgi:hypothetical protein
MKKGSGLVAILTLSVLASSAQAFTYSQGRQLKVKDNHLIFHVDIPGVSRSGISWNTAFDQAADGWSAVTPVQVSTVRQAASPCAYYDGVGGVGYSSNLCGYLTEATKTTAGTALIELILPLTIKTGDIAFNPNMPMDVYDGDLVPIIDFRRTAAHEIGHILGLGHSLFPRSMLTISKNQVYDKDRLNADDICGVNISHGNNEGCPLLLRNATTLSGNATSGRGVCRSRRHLPDSIRS